MEWHEARRLLVRRDPADGADVRALSRGVAAGTLVRVRPGVHVDAALWRLLAKEERLQLRMLALHLTARSRPVFSHWAAALLHGLPVAREATDRVDVAVEGTRSRAVAGARAHALALDGAEVVEVEGMLCTSAARTLVDVGADAGFEQAVVLADAALALLGPDARRTMGEAVELAGRVRGAARLDRVLAFADPRSGSPGESISRVRMHLLGFVAPELQVEIVTDGRRELGDFGWEQVLGLGEFDGERKYRDDRMRGGGMAEDVVATWTRPASPAAAATGVRSRRLSVERMRERSVDRALVQKPLRRGVRPIWGSRARRPGPTVEAMTAAAEPRLLSRRVLAWTAWDWGSAAFNAVITTFVFTVYLTSDAFTGLAEGDPGYPAAKAVLSSGLGWGIALAGVAVALIAPVLGRRADESGRRRRSRAAASAAGAAAMFGMFAVTPVPSSFWLGVALVGLGTVAYEAGAVNYNAMLLSISTPRSIGRISAFGWASGYVGGIVLLLVLFATLIPQGPLLLGIPALTQDGLGVRISAVVCAIWFTASAIPVLLAIPDEAPTAPAAARTGLLGTYRRLWRDIRQLGRDDRNLLGFLIASAVFRDGLTGVFTFGAVIASAVFGFTFAEVLIFGVAANLVAGVSTFVSGRFDDRFGPKPVILVSLVGLVITGTAVFLLRDAGTSAFWVGGLTLCLFVGPAQTSSRSLLGRLSPEDRAGELFGLYATTGRAASFIAPAAFAAFTAIAQDQGFGILGIVLVLAVGLVLMLPVRGTAATA